MRASRIVSALVEGSFGFFGKRTTAFQSLRISWSEISIVGSFFFSPDACRFRSGEVWDALSLKKYPHPPFSDALYKPLNSSLRTNPPTLLPCPDKSGCFSNKAYHTFDVGNIPVEALLFQTGYLTVDTASSFPACVLCFIPFMQALTLAGNVLQQIHLAYSLLRMT